MRIFCTSIPKSGSHLLFSVFLEMGYEAVPIPKSAGSKDDGIVRFQAALRSASLKAKPYVGGHWRADSQLARALRKRQFKSLVLVRDPRDVCISMADFLLAGRPAIVHVNEPRLRRMSRRDLIVGNIVGIELPNFRLKPVRKVFQGWLEWQQYDAQLIRYEELERAVRNQTIPESIRTLGLDSAHFLRVLTEMFGNKSSEFVNKAEVVRWKKEFDPDLLRIWNENAAGLATQFGYSEASD